MKAFKTFVVVLGCAASVTFMARAQDKHAGKEAAKHAAFEKLKSLKGDWEVTGGQNKEGPGGTFSYRLTAGGSAVLETLFGGTEHEMVTIYYLDGEHLSLTHYCMLQNRPHMRAEKQSSPDKLTFKCHEGAKGESSKIEAEDHMHQVTFTFADADHVKSEWVLFKGGKQDSVHSFDLTRKKK